MNVYPQLNKKIHISIDIKNKEGWMRSIFFSSRFHFPQIYFLLSKIQHIFVLRKAKTIFPISSPFLWQILRDKSTFNFRLKTRGEFSRQLRGAKPTERATWSRRSSSLEQRAALSFLFSLTFSLARKLPLSYHPDCVISQPLRNIGNARRKSLSHWFRFNESPGDFDKFGARNSRAKWRTREDTGFRFYSIAYLSRDFSNVIKSVIFLFFKSFFFFSSRDG